MNRYEKQQLQYDLSELLSKESLRWYFTQVIKNGLTKEELLAYKLLREHFRLHIMDRPFDMVKELNTFVWQNHYRRGLILSYLELAARMEHLGVLVW